MGHVDWHQIFIHDLTRQFAVEIILRTAMMFLVVLVILRLSGKRGIRQLSIFELAIIISLGSAVGDPMFNDDIAMLPAILVCVTVIGLYRCITWIMTKYEHVENALEGKPVYIVEEGIMVIKEDTKNTLSKDEFFAELREQGVEHLGQVRTAILETSGNMSILYYTNEDIKPGLPIYPKLYDLRAAVVPTADLYACAFCGWVAHLQPGRHRCSRCRHHEWVRTIATKRIS